MLKEQNSTSVGPVSVRYSQDITESARRGVVELIANFEPILPGPCTELRVGWEHHALGERGFMMFWASESGPGHDTLLINQEMWEAADSYGRTDAFLLALFFAVLRNQGDYYYDGLFDVWVARLAGQTYVEKDPMQIMLATPAEMGWTGRRMN